LLRYHPTRSSHFCSPGGCILCLLALVGCSHHEVAAVGALQLRTAATEASVQQRRAGDLAYEHTVNIELDGADLASRVRAIQAACTTDKQFGCTVLEVSVRSADQLPSGMLRLRLAPAGVDTFVSAASKGGKITDRTTHAEDLAQPVADNERQLAMLTTHRDRLMQFMNDRSLKVDQLITVSKELASAQSQIETLSNTQANLRRRIDTELLSLQLSVPSNVIAAARTPVAEAVRSFRMDFTDAVAQVIRFVAALIPWLVVIIPGIILVRMFWRAVGRWLMRRERSSASSAQV
jgi:hypothetical protein